MENTNKQAIPSFSFADFLLRVAPNEIVTIEDLWMNKGGTLKIMFPALLPLFCRKCNGERYFAPYGEESFYQNSTKEIFITYGCKNCAGQFKTYALSLTKRAENAGSGMKYGEHPPFGPVTPPDIEHLLGDDAPLFRKGVEAESR